MSKPLLGPPNLDQLKFIVRLANDQKDGAELRKLIAAWQSSGPDLRKLFNTVSGLQEKLSPSNCYLEPRGKGGVLIWMPKTAGSSPLESEDAALSMFGSFLIHPEIERFAGPCPRCSKFYLKNSLRQKVYCSRACGAMQNAAEATRKRRTREHWESLEKARIAIEKWKESRNSPDWKAYVAGRTALTAKFLTRAVNKGELTAPRRAFKLRNSAMSS